MIPILKSNGAKFVAFDLLFPEKDSTRVFEIRGLQKAIQDRGPSPNDAWLADSLSELEKNWIATALPYTRPKREQQCLSSRPWYLWEV
jgi:hypothetical protein